MLYYCDIVIYFSRNFRNALTFTKKVFFRDLLCITDSQFISALHHENQCPIWTRRECSDSPDLVEYQIISGWESMLLIFWFVEEAIYFEKGKKSESIISDSSQSLRLAQSSLSYWIVQKCLPEAHARVEKPDLLAAISWPKNRPNRTTVAAFNLATAFLSFCTCKDKCLSWTWSMVWFPVLSVTIIIITRISLFITVFLKTIIRVQKKTKHS